MNISFVDLKRQLYGDPVQGSQGILPEIRSALDACIENTSFVMGPQLDKFEQEFASYCEAPYSVGLNSGTDALEFALRCNGITSGNVITVPNSYFTTTSSISQAGAAPRFVDVDPRTFNMDVEKLRDAIDNETKAILLVHLYGHPAEMDKITEIAREYNLKMIEDCCHANGARYKGKRVPVSKTGVFSFYPGKNLGGWGDGGALITDDVQVKTKALMWRNDGSFVKYHHEILGRKARLDTIQAAILSVKLKYLDQWNALRRKHASSYNRKLKEIKDLQLPPLGDDNYEPVFHLYAIHTPKRDQLQKFLTKKGIATVMNYPTPIHLQPAYKHLNLPEGSFPIAESLAKKTLSLPMFPELREDEIECVCNAIKEFFSKTK